MELVQACSRDATLALQARPSFAEDEFRAHRRLHVLHRVLDVREHELSPEGHPWLPLALCQLNVLTSRQVLTQLTEASRYLLLK